MSGVSRYNEIRKQMEVLEMFRHKAEKRIVELGSEQLRLAKHALLAFRNKLIAQGKPTEDITINRDHAAISEKQLHASRVDIKLTRNKFAHDEILHIMTS